MSATKHEALHLKVRELCTNDVDSDDNLFCKYAPSPYHSSSVKWVQFVFCQLPFAGTMNKPVSEGRSSYPKWVGRVRQRKWINIIIWEKFATNVAENLSSDILRTFRLLPPTWIWPLVRFFVQLRKSLHFP